MFDTRRHLLTVLIGFLLTFVSSFGQNFFIAIFGGEIRRAFDLSNGQFGTLYSMVTITAAIALIWMGRLVDRFSALTVGMVTVFALASAAWLLSHAHHVVALALALCALRLFGQGMAVHLAVTTMTRCFDARSRGKALGLAMTGNPVGEATLPLAAVTAMAWVGWRDVWLAVTMILVVVFLPGFLVLLAGNERARRAAPAPAPYATGPLPPAADQSWKVAQILRHPLFYLLLPGLLAPVFINTAIFFHQDALSQAKGWNPAWFVAGYPFSSGANVCATLAVGWLVDRIGSLRLLPFILLPQLAALVLLTATNEPAIIPVFLALAGATMGTVLPLQGVILADVYGTKHFGAIRAVVTACNVLLGALGPALVGWLVDTGISFEAQAAAISIYVLFCVVLFLAARPVAYRHLQKRPVL